MSPILSLSVMVILISLSSTYRGKLCPSSVAIHTITKKKVLRFDCRNRSYHDSSSSTLYTTSQHICFELFITLPDHLEDKYLFTLKMSSFLLNCLKVNTSKGFERDWSNSCVLRSLSLGDDLPEKRRLRKNILLFSVCSISHVYRKITNSFYALTCSIIFCCLRHTVTELNSSSPGFSYQYWGEENESY